MENLIKKENADFMRNLKKKGQEKGDNVDWTHLVFLFWSCVTFLSRARNEIRRREG